MSNRICSFFDYFIENNQSNYNKNENETSVLHLLTFKTPT